MIQPANLHVFYAARTRAEHRDHRAAEVLTRFDFNLIQFIHSWFAKTREKGNRYFFLSYIKHDVYYRAHKIHEILSTKNTTCMRD